VFVKQLMLLVILLASIIGAIMLFLKYKRMGKINYLILSVFMSAIFFIIFETGLISFFGNESNTFFVVLASYVFYPVILLMAPLSYLYVKSFSIVQQENLTFSKCISHFVLPLSLLIINIFSFIALRNIEEDTQNFILLTNIVTYLNFTIFFIIFLIQNIFYAYLSYNVYNEHRVDFQFDKESSILTLSWIKRFLISYFSILALLYIFQLGPLVGGKIIFRITLLIYFVYIIYFGLKDYEELFEESRPNDNILDDTLRNKLKTQVNQAIEIDKLHLDPELNLQVFAQKIHSNTKYLSKFINQEYNKSYSTFINEMRIKTAVELLTSENTKNYTIETISLMSGFNSKSSFNTAFKKVYNQTPSEFRDGIA
jgi:AraC-like DNA-binding protein